MAGVDIHGTLSPTSAVPVRRFGSTSGPRFRIGGSVVVSVMIESLALAAIGGAIGGLLAYAAFNGYQTSTMNFTTFSQVAFAFKVTPALLVTGLVYALLMGLIGGIFPAIRAARLPIPTALRAL